LFGQRRGITNGTGATFATIGTPLVISDCSTAHVFRASTGTSQNADNAGAATSALWTAATSPLGKSYAAGSEIMLFRSYTYFLQMGASGQPALFRLDNNKPVLAGSNPEELIEGIENMQVTYGLDTDAVLDGSANRYIAAPTAAQWPIVVSMRIVLTARSIDDNIMSTNNPLRTFNGANNWVDRRLFKTFTASIDLRNR
jgi:type IV pilus assembly protein PilW